MGNNPVGLTSHSFLRIVLDAIDDSRPAQLTMKGRISI